MDAAARYQTNADSRPRPRSSAKYFNKKGRDELYQVELTVPQAKLDRGNNDKVTLASALSVKDTVASSGGGTLLRSSIGALRDKTDNKIRVQSGFRRISRIGSIKINPMEPATTNDARREVENKT